MKQRSYDEKMASINTTALKHIKKAFENMGAMEISYLGRLARDGNLGLMTRFWENLKELSQGLKEDDE